MKDGSHGNGRVNIEIAPVLARAQRAESELYFDHVSYFLTTAIHSKNNIPQKTYVLAAGSYVRKHSSHQNKTRHSDHVNRMWTAKTK